MSSPLDPLRLRRLLDVGRRLVAELDPGVVLEQILAAACEATGARYAAIGILDERRTELEQFLTLGLDEQTRMVIGEPPHGRGVLGVLIDHPRPLRLSDVSEHPSSYGFPAGHPVMRNFLGVPIVIRGAPWGNLYLTEKEHGEFTAADEEAATILAGWAATAIENARLHQLSEHRRVEQERAVRGLEATRDIAIALGGTAGLEHMLELIVERGRVLVEARSVVIMLRDGADLVVTASAGHAIDARGRRLPISASTSGEVLALGRPGLVDVASGLRVSPAELGVPDAHAALLVPMISRGEPLGVLAAFDRGERAESFTDADEQLLRAFAASAATAVAMAQSVESQRVRSSIAAADAERSRWARELHDETLQGLGALRLLLASARRRDDPREAALAVTEAIEQIEQEIENLHAIISDLRPAALDELGLRPALEALIRRRGATGSLVITSELVLADGKLGADRVARETESTVYRLVQEALTNVVKHAGAQAAHVAVVASAGEVSIEVRDDGVGFAPDVQRSGFGLMGARERVFLAGGTLTIESGARGTVVRARLPALGARPSRSPAE